MPVAVNDALWSSASPIATLRHGMTVLSTRWLTQVSWCVCADPSAHSGEHGGHLGFTCRDAGPGWLCRGPCTQTGIDA
jgi:hypothetical protein